MRVRTILFLAIASIAAGGAFAQNGAGSGPPKHQNSMPSTGLPEFAAPVSLVERYVFTVSATEQPGIQRHDLWTGRTDTVWSSPFPAGHAAFDQPAWTPWGTLIVAEQSWETAPEGSTSPYGRLFELEDPFQALPISHASSATDPGGAQLVHRNVIPRAAHRGIQFDSAGNMYFLDGANGGHLYKYTPAASLSDVKSGRADYFAAGRTSVLRVGDGSVANATGASTWVPFTNAAGMALPGALTITDIYGVRSVDARNTTSLPQFKGTDFRGLEAIQIRRIGDREYLYVTFAATDRVHVLDLKQNTMSVFASQNGSIVRLPQIAPARTDSSIDKPPQSVGTDSSITKPPQSVGTDSSIIKPPQSAGTDASIDKPPQ